jgi:DNA-binding PadR family transcriptional regulator
MTLVAEDKIIAALFEKENLSFRGICDTGIPSKTVHRNLKKLVSQKLVSETGRPNWKQGKRLTYHLTKKGLERYSKTTIQELNFCLDRTTKLLACSLTKPIDIRKKIVNAWKASLIDPIPTKTGATSGWSSIDSAETELKRIKNYTQEEINQEMMSVEKIFGPIYECLKTVYRFYLITLDTDLYTDVNGKEQENSYNLQDWLLGFTKGEYPYFVYVNELRDRGINLPI